MLRVGTQKLSELRVGTQKIKEAWVGAVKVFSGGWPAVPADGIMLKSDGTQAGGITVSNIDRYGGKWRIWRRNNEGTISNVIFSQNSTTLTFDNFEGPVDIGTLYVYIDGITIGFIQNTLSQETKTITIPVQFRNNSPHVISFSGGSGAYMATSVRFNI